MMDENYNPEIHSVTMRRVHNVGSKRANARDNLPKVTAPKAGAPPDSATFRILVFAKTGAF
jgi:hypothetical protein